MSGFKVCLTNNGKNEWLALPTDRDTAFKALRAISAEDGTYNITACEFGFGKKLDAMITGADLSTVNYLAAQLLALSPKYTEILEVMLTHLPDVLSSIAKVIDFPNNAGAYEVYRNIHNAEDLALFYINDSGQIQMPEEWARGIDLERFGKTLEKHERGHYTKYGYLIATGLDWKPCFEKSGEVPSEYRITASDA